MRGGAVLQSSNGYRVETEELAASFAEAAAWSDVEVRATGPVGNLTAGSMEFRMQQGASAGYLLVFNDGVHLIYEPQP